MPSNPFKVVSQKAFIKGIVAVSNRFSVPKGAVQSAINMLLGERGALTTCDGTLIQASIPNSYGPVLELGTYVNPATFVATLLAIAAEGTAVSGNVGLYSWATGGGPATHLADQTITSGWTLPQLFNFAGYTVFTAGNNVTPLLWDGTALTAVTTHPNWQASTLYQIGDRIVAPSSTGSSAWTVIAETLGYDSASGSAGQTESSTTPISGFGYSGASAPNFASITQVGQTIRDNQIVWQLTALDPSFAAQTVPLGGAHGIVYADALWLFNTSPSNSGLDGPSVIRQSTVNNPNSWPNVNTAFVGKDDGTYGTGVASFTIAEAGISPTGSLILFKNFQTYQVTGVFGAPNFAIQQVKSDMGCVASRTPLFATGFGVIRLSHLGFALFDGVNDTLISEEVRPYLFGRADITAVDWANINNSRSALINNPPMYCCACPIVGQSGNATRIFCYDLILKAWMIVDITGIEAWAAFKQIRIAGGGTPVTYAGDAIPDNLGNYYIRQWQNGDTTWDGHPITWNVTPPEIGDPGSRAYFRRILLRGHTATGSLANLAITVQPILSAVAAQAITLNPLLVGPQSSGVTPPNFLSEAFDDGGADVGLNYDIGIKAQSAHAQVSGSGQFTLEAIDWHIRILPPRPFQQVA